MTDIIFSAAIADAIDSGHPVVALESTIFSNLGLPSPANEEALTRTLAAVVGAGASGVAGAEGGAGAGARLVRLQVLVLVHLSVLVQVVAVVVLPSCGACAIEQERCPSPQNCRKCFTKSV